MGRIKDALTHLLPFDREEKALKAFGMTAQEAGLSHQAFIDRALCDFIQPEGVLLICPERLGNGKQFASFFEFMIEKKTSQLIVMGISLNLDCPLSHLLASDSLSVAKALEDAGVALDSWSQNGDGGVILRRNQLDRPIGAFVVSQMNS